MIGRRLCSRKVYDSTTTSRAKADGFKDWSAWFRPQRYMTRKPNNKVADSVYPTYIGTRENIIRVDGCTQHGGTVFATWAKSRWTWDFKKQIPLAFWIQREAHYANYCMKRRLRRRGVRLHWLSFPVCSHSSATKTISVPLWPND